MKLWIDEDLTPRLVDPAHAHGYEATSNREQGLLGATDAALYEVVVDGDYVFVTNDEQDFRRLCRAHDLHPGLIVLPERIRVEQVAMFERVPGRRPAAGWSTASSKSTKQPKSAATTHCRRRRPTARREDDASAGAQSSSAARESSPVDLRERPPLVNAAPSSAASSLRLLVCR
jgi:predicted nuclease of predicted toxin-antitoxin system